jgi:hypothetical protein
MSFEEMEAANAWHLTPARWYREPRWSRVTMLATLRARRKLDYWLLQHGAAQPQITRG